MSEFECYNGHLVAPSQMLPGNRCPKCKEKVIRMDGLSSRQLSKLEEDWDKKIEREREEEKE